MKRVFIFILFPVLVSLLFVGFSAGQIKESSCVRCHTDEEALQRLYKVPAALLEPAGEG